MSALRASHDRIVVLRSGLSQAARSLLGSWRDAGAAQFDQEYLRPLDQDADRLARAVAAADTQIDTALTALRRARST